jgi:hypothetical protein
MHTRPNTSIADPIIIGMLYLLGRPLMEIVRPMNQNGKPLAASAPTPISTG